MSEKVIILNQLDLQDFKAYLKETVADCCAVSDVPDFEISISQAQIILGVTYPTIVTYMNEGTLQNISTDNRRAKFNFYDVLQLRRENIKYKRFRTLNNSK